MMKTFIINAEATFQAEDIDDAFLKLRAHFNALLEDEESDLITSGSIRIRPEETPGGPEEEKKYV